MTLTWVIPATVFVHTAYNWSAQNAFQHAQLVPGYGMARIAELDHTLCPERFPRWQLYAQSAAAVLSGIGLLVLGSVCGADAIFLDGLTALRLHVVVQNGSSFKNTGRYICLTARRTI